MQLFSNSGITSVIPYAPPVERSTFLRASEGLSRSRSEIDQALVLALALKLPLPECMESLARGPLTIEGYKRPSISGFKSVYLLEHCR